MKILNRSESPVILPEKPWELETDLLYSIAVLPDPEEDRLRLYYLVRNYLKKEIGLLCVAYSEDGYSWTRPEFSDGTNIVMRPAGPPIDYGFFVPFSVLYDPWETEMGDRWKMIYWDRPDRDDPTGICLAVSPDGLHWRSTSRNPIITASNDAASLLCTDPDLPKPHPSSPPPISSTSRHGAMIRLCPRTRTWCPGCAVKSRSGEVTDFPARMAKCVGAAPSSSSLLMSRTRRIPSSTGYVRFAPEMDTAPFSTYTTRSIKRWMLRWSRAPTVWPGNGSITALWFCPRAARAGGIAGW